MIDPWPLVCQYMWLEFAYMGEKDDEDKFGTNFPSAALFFPPRLIVRNPDLPRV